MQIDRTLARTMLSLACALFACDGRSHQGHAHGDHGSAAAADVKVVKIADTMVVDQDGRKLRLADVVADKLVVVTFVFTHCVDTCPVVSHTFSQVQQLLGPLMDKRVRLLSLTVDPARDTPARLKSYSSQFFAGPGWLWLTGEQPAVTSALQGFGVHVTNPENHPILVLVGDARSGRWTRLHDIDNARKIVETVGEHLAAQSGHIGASAVARSSN
jgi:protein SCO1/2